MRDPLSRTPADDSDEALMLRVRDDAGGREAFAGLVRRHQTALVNFFRMGGVNHDAEDLAQETLLRLYRSRHRYRPSAAFRTFLYTLARHVAIDAWRRRQRRERTAEALQQAPPPEGGDDAARRAEGRREAVREALAALPVKLRLVVLLSVYQGLNYEEVGQALGIPTGTVKSRMFLAVRRLRETLEAAHEI